MDIFSRRTFLAKASVIAAAAPILNALFGRTALAADESQTPKAGAAWYARGVVIDPCSCEVACPCQFGNAPTAGYCHAVMSWHVDRGRFGDVVLDGLNAAMSFDSPGHVAKGNWKIGLYIDQRADARQREALTEIFSGRAGGPLAVFAGPLVGERLGVKAVPMQYEATGKRRRMVIPALAEVDVVAIEGRGGADVTITNLPVSQHTSEARVVAKSTRLMYRDYGSNWEIAGKNATYSNFVYFPA